MILPSLKKLRTTRPSIRLLTNASLSTRWVASGVGRLVLLGGVGILFATNAATSLGAGELKWSRPTTARRVVERVVVSRHEATFRDAAVVAAVWAEDDQYVSTVEAIETPSNTDRSVVVRRSGSSMMPPAERLARLPEDPFDQEFDESEFGVEDPPIEEVEEAIEQEIDRRENEEQPAEEPSVDDLFGDSTEENETTEGENPSELFGEEIASEEIGVEETDSEEIGNGDAVEEMAEEFGETTDYDPFDEPLGDAFDEAERAIEREIAAPLEESDPSDPFGESMRSQGGVETPDISELFDREMAQEESGDSAISGEDVEDLELDVRPEPSAEDLELEPQNTDEPDAIRLEREESARNCEEEISKIRSEKIDDIDPSIYLQGKAGQDFPYECRLDAGSHQPRQWPQITYNWKAAALCHKPLYFEQVHLERYGHSWGPYVQPIMSGVHFFGTLPILPYKMGIRTPTECVYTLGYYRPGSCAPYLIDPVPFTWRAAFFEAGFATGAAFAIP